MKAGADGKISKSYPFNPNGSPFGIAGLCTQDGRHLAMMPHPERTFLKWQWPWMPGYLNDRPQGIPMDSDVPKCQRVVRGGEIREGTQGRKGIN